MPAAQGNTNDAAVTNIANPTASATRSTWRVLEARTRQSAMRPELKAAPQRPATAALTTTKGTWVLVWFVLFVLLGARGWSSCQAKKRAPLRRQGRFEGDRVPLTAAQSGQISPSDLVKIIIQITTLIIVPPA